MSWNYRVLRTTDCCVDNQWHYIAEVYYDDQGKPEMWTPKAMRPGGTTLDELRGDLGYMLKALDAPVLEVFKDDAGRERLRERQA